MNDSKLFHILKIIRSFLFSSVNKEFLIFLFFLVLSGTFWLLMSLNETYEKEIEVPVTLVDIPRNVVLTSDTTTTIRVTVRDKGYYLLAYLYSNKIRTVNIKFNNYAKKTGTGTVSSAELQKIIYQQLFNSSHITSIKPDKYEFFFNYGLKKRVPVKLNGKITLGQSYYLAKVIFSPDSIDIYASREVLDSMKFVYTERLSITNLTDTVIRNISLSKTRGVKNVPENVRISLFPDILTEESIEVPIEAVNMPEGKVLRTFPSRVTVTFTIGASIFRTIKPNKFKVIVDYNELIDSASEKCNVYLRYIPHGVRNAKMNVTKVDYLIEEQ